MTTSINSLAAKAHVDDLHRIAEHRRLITGTPHPNVAEPADASAVALRLAGADDGEAVRNLADLDDASIPDGEVLLAFIDGDAVAALSLRDGHVVANPFVPTEAAVALLRLRAEHLSGRHSCRRRVFSLRPRFA